MSLQSSESQTPVPHRAEQDQVIANDITEFRQIIDTVRDEPAILEILSKHGYDLPNLDPGLALQEAVESAFASRQHAMAAQELATGALDGAETNARRVYVGFREVARALHLGSADRTSLGLNEDLPNDRQKFITIARASCEAALNEPFLSRLESRGFGTEYIQSALALLDPIIESDNIQNVAIAAAVKATADRDQAYEAIKVWITEFKHIAKVALRDRPDLQKALEVRGP